MTISLVDACVEALVDACPTDDECLEDETACWKKHPIHGTTWVDDELLHIEGDVGAIVRTVLDAVFAWHATQRPDGGNIAEEPCTQTGPQ